MSGRPIDLGEEEHLSGTTWGGFSLLWADDEGVPLDLTGSDARIVFRSAGTQIVMDWHLSDPAKPGLSLADDPTTGVLYVRGPGVISGDPGPLKWDLKVWHALSGEVFVDVQGTLRLLQGQTP